MGAIKLDKFGGMLPAWNNVLLPDGQASYSLNGYLFSGALIGWRQPKLLYQLKRSTSRYAFRIPNRVTNATAITASDSFWYEFDDPDTNVIRTPVVEDQYQRYYFASPSQPPQYATYDMIMASQTPWLLGVPGSGCAPGVMITGGGQATQLGFSTITNGGALTFIPANSIFLIPIVPNGTLLIQDVAFISDYTDPNVKFQAVVYTDLNGVPYELLGVGNVVTGTTAGVQATGTFTNAVSVQPNATYWVGIAIDSANWTFVANIDSTSGALTSNTFSNGPPAVLGGSFGTNLAQAGNFQMWADMIGQSVFEARGYVYTWVTAYGEEGPPSPPTLVNGWSNGIWTISLFTPDPLDMGVRRNIVSTRIYRTVTSSTGTGSYFLVAEIPVTQATYQDTTDDATVANNAQMLSLYWYEPPADLKGFASFINGMTVSFKSNEIWFSEPYRPHAWPPGYVLTTEFPIIGIGVAGQAIVVCTAGTPYVLNGANPASMSMSKINLTEPCLHRGSIVSTDTTVLYASQNGLIQVSQSGAGSNITEGWITRERWQGLTPVAQPGRIRAIKHATSYFAFGSVVGTDNSVAQQGFTVELSTEDQTSFTIWPQAGGHRLGFSQLSSPNGFDIDNVELDAWTGVGLLIQNNAIYYYDFTDQAPVIVPYRWRSKTYQPLTKKNFAAFRVWFDVPASTPPQVNRDLDDPQPTLGSNQYGIIRVYADGNLWTTRELRTSGELLRIYSGDKFDTWSFEIEGRVSVSNMQVATTVKELGLI